MLLAFAGGLPDPRTLPHCRGRQRHRMLVVGGAAGPFCLTLFFVVPVLHTANLHHGLDSTVLGTSSIYIYIHMYDVSM